MPGEPQKNQVQKHGCAHPQRHDLAEQRSENLDHRKKTLVLSTRERGVNKDSDAELVAQKRRSGQNENQKQDLHFAQSLSEGPEKARRLLCDKENRCRSWRMLQPLFLPVCFGHQRCSIPIVLDSLDENGNSGADQNKETDHTAFPIGRHAKKDERVIDHRYKKNTDQCAENTSSTSGDPRSAQDDGGQYI